MKKRTLTVLCAVLVGLVNIKARAEEESTAAAADIVVGRPLCFAATVVGSALFLVSLPIAACSGSVHKTAHVLVVQPATYTFRRPIGDFGPTGDEGMRPLNKQ